MVKPLSQRYEHFSATRAEKWQPIIATSFGERALKWGEYETYLRTSYRIGVGDVIAPSELDVTLAGEAKSFVEQTFGIEVDCDVAKVSHIHDNLHGLYDPMLHCVVYVEHPTGSEYGDAIAKGSVLVHEFTHSTAANTATVIDIEFDDSHSIDMLQPHHVAEIAAGFTKDNFFEEGLAEEIASRWREQFDQRLKNRDRDLIAREGIGEVPARMYVPAHPIDETTTDMERGIQYPAVCAYGIQLLTEYTGVDIISLLIKSRHEATRQHASEVLKATIDSIEPGLYDVLINAEYTLDDFNDCVRIIKQAIANHALDQAKNAA